MMPYCAWWVPILWKMWCPNCNFGKVKLYKYQLAWGMSKGARKQCQVRNICVWLHLSYSICFMIEIIFRMLTYLEFERLVFALLIITPDRIQHPEYNNDMLICQYFLVVISFLIAQSWYWSTIIRQLSCFCTFNVEIHYYLLCVYGLLSCYVDSSWARMKSFFSCLYFVKVVLENVLC